MLKKILYILLYSSFFFMGCQQSDSPQTIRKKNGDPATTILNYLEKRNLPTMESVSIWENDFTGARPGNIFRVISNT